MKSIFVIIAICFIFLINIKAQNVLILNSYENQTDAVFSASIDAFEKYIVAGGRDNKLFLYDKESGNLVREFSGHSDYINDVIFSPDATKIASASNDNSVKIWDVEKGGLLLTLTGHSDDVKQLEYSSDGKKIASASLDNTVKIWNSETGDLIYNLYGFSDKVNSLSFSPDDKYIITGSRDNIIRKFEIKEETLIRDFKGHSAEVKCVDFNPDGKTFASSSYDNTIKIWDAETGEIYKTLTGHSGSVNFIDYSSDGKYLVSCSSDNTIKLWNLDQGICIHTFKGHNEIVYSVRFSNNNKSIVSSSEDKSVKVWDVDKIIKFKESVAKDAFQILMTENSIRCLDFNNLNTKIVVGTSSGKVLVYDIQVKGNMLKIDNEGTSVNSLAISSDEKFIAAATNNNDLIIYDAISGSVYKTLSGHSKGINSVDFSSDNKYVVSGSQDKNIKVWKVSTGENISTLFGYSDVVNCIHISSDGTSILSGDNSGILRIWDLTSGELLKTLEGHTGAIKSAVFSPDGKYIVSCSYDKTLKIWDALRGKCINTIEGHSNTVYSVAFSPDGKYFASGSADYSVKIWELSSGNLIHSFDNLDFVVNTISFSPDGLYLAAAGETNYVQVWNVGDLIEVEDIENEVVSVTRKSIKSTDTESPEVSIISPISDNEKKFEDVSNTVKTLTIKGKADDESGVFEVIINGKDASLAESGFFQSDVLLKVGLNEINVTVTDLQGNTYEEKYFVTRTSDEALSENQETEKFYAGTYYALLFGVSDYQDANIPDLDSLPIKDAELLASVLKANYTFEDYNVQVINNPTRKDIIRAFDELTKKVTDEDNVLIFYAGHGNYDAESDLGYWIPVDAELEYTDNWIYNDIVVSNMKRIKSRHTLLISDACFSGSIFKSRDISTDNVLAYYKKYQLPSRKAMTSGTLKTVPNKSVFLYYLADKLSENTETYYSASELFRDLEIPVGNNSPTTPQYGVIQGVGDEGGEFIFIKK